jgi:hypothetical protein
MRADDVNLDRLQGVSAIAFECQENRDRCVAGWFEAAKA